MVTEFDSGTRREKIAAAAVPPAPTLAVWRARSFGSLFGGIVLLMTMFSTLAPAQERSASGRIPLFAPAVAEPGPFKGVQRGTADGSEPKGAAIKVAQPERKPQSRSALNPGAKPKAEFKAQTGILHTAMSKRVPPADPVAAPNDRSARMAECRQQIKSALQPSRVIKLAGECERDFPASQFAAEIQRIAMAARQALEIQRSTGLSGDFFEEAVGDEAYRDNLGKAVRGDKDAAYSLALAYRAGISGVVASPRRMEQWLRFAAELGSGVASWELAEFYNYSGFVADAARFEKKALDLGFRPPFRLPTRGY